MRCGILYRTRPLCRLPLLAWPSRERYFSPPLRILTNTSNTASLPFLLIDLTLLTHSPPAFQEGRRGAVTALCAKFTAETTVLQERKEGEGSSPPLYMPLASGSFVANCRHHRFAKWSGWLGGLASLSPSKRALAENVNAPTGFFLPLFPSQKIEVGGEE